MSKQRVSIPRQTGSGDAMAPGTYFVDDQGIPHIRCAECNGMGPMSDHEISANGDVNPSILCPHCGWHVWGTLEDWSE